MNTDDLDLSENISDLLEDYLSQYDRLSEDFAIVARFDGKDQVKFCNVFKQLMPSIITTVEKYIELFLIATDPIAGILFEKSKYLLSSIITTTLDLSRIFSFFSEEQFIEAATIIKINAILLFNIFHKPSHIEGLFSYFDVKKCILACRQFERQFILMFNTIDDVISVFICLNDWQQNILYTEFHAHIFSLIKTKTDYDCLLNWISESDSQKLKQKIESFVVKKFFDQFDIQKSDYWKNKNIDCIALSEIIDHALTEPLFGFFSITGALTRKHLEALGVDITLLKQMKKDEQYDYVLEKIYWPVVHFIPTSEAHLLR